MMDEEAPFGVDDKVVHHARNLEIPPQLKAGVDYCDPGEITSTTIIGAGTSMASAGLARHNKQARPAQKPLFW